MRITRIYTPQPLSTDCQIILEASASAHLVKVLRLRTGAVVVLFNGDGFDYQAELISPRAEVAQLQLHSRTSGALESPLRVTLIQALCRGEKMDWVLEKACELGVHAIVPISSERSEVHLSPERAAKRREHWQRVVLSACEQSGRAYVPQVAALKELSHYLAESTDPALRWVLEPGGAPLASLPGLAGAGAIAVAVGPEGGWSDRDLAQLTHARFTAVELGPRILRTETAGVAVLACLQTLAGDFAGSGLAARQ